MKVRGFRKGMSLRLSLKGEAPASQAKVPVHSKPPPKPAVPYMALFKYSSSWDKFQVYMGLFLSLATGCILPTYGLVVGKVV